MTAPERGRPKKYAGRTTTTVRLAPELITEIDRLADERDVSRNWLITRLLTRGIESLHGTEETP